MISPGSNPNAVCLEGVTLLPVPLLKEPKPVIIRSPEGWHPQPIFWWGYCLRARDACLGILWGKPDVNVQPEACRREYAATSHALTAGRWPSPISPYELPAPEGFDRTPSGYAPFSFPDQSPGLIVIWQRLRAEVKP